MTTEREAAALARVPFVPWDEFLAQLVWLQGEHVSIVGPTGTGKSTLIDALLPVRERRGGHVLVLGTKPRDRTLDRMLTRGYTRVRDWPAQLPFWRRREPDWERLLLLWPSYRHKDDAQAMGAIFDRALADVFVEGGRVVVADEVYFLCRILGLEDWANTLWTQGRSLGITFVAGTQRPAHVPLFMYDQAVHLLLFGDNDERNLQRVGGLGGLSADLIRGTIAALPHHEVLYVNTRTRALLRTRVR